MGAFLGLRYQCSLPDTATRQPGLLDATPKVSASSTLGRYMRIIPVLHSWLSRRIQGHPVVGLPGALPGGHGKEENGFRGKQIPKFLFGSMDDRRASKNEAQAYPQGRPMTSGTQRFPKVQSGSPSSEVTSIWQRFSHPAIVSSDCRYLRLFTPTCKGSSSSRSVSPADLSFAVTGVKESRMGSW